MLWVSMHGLQTISYSTSVDLGVLRFMMHLHVLEAGGLHVAAGQRANELSMPGLAPEPVLQTFLATAHILRRKLVLQCLLF